MKTNTFFLFVILGAQGLYAQTTHTVQEIGFSYDPETLTINAGESVKFEGSASHPIAEVSQTTWDNNGNTPLETGFAFSTGSGTVNFTTAGTYYYVCTAHVASQGMKGKIIVLAPAALDETSPMNDYVIYPSPLTGNDLFIASPAGGHRQFTAEIYDLTGNLQISFPESSMEETMHLDCSVLPKGLFLLKVKNEGEEYVSKLIRL